MLVGWCGIHIRWNAFYLEKIGHQGSSGIHSHIRRVRLAVKEPELSRVPSLRTLLKCPRSNFSTGFGFRSKKWGPLWNHKRLVIFSIYITMLNCIWPWFNRPFEGWWIILSHSHMMFSAACCSWLLLTRGSLKETVTKQATWSNSAMITMCLDF